MITCSNIKRHDNVPFDYYLQMPGYSHSFLKREQNGLSPFFEMTDNIRLGGLVDAIITDPENADMTSHLYNDAKMISSYISNTFSVFLKNSKMQISYTGDLHYEGFTMPVKGRLDMLIEGVSVVDLKLTKSRIKDIDSLTYYMGYANQLWLYSRLSGIRSAYLLFYSTIDKRTHLKNININNDDNLFWKEKILKFGRYESKN